MKKILSLFAIMMMAVTSAFAAPTLTADKTTCKVGETVNFSSDYNDCAGYIIHINSTSQSVQSNDGILNYAFTPSSAGTYTFYCATYTTVMYGPIPFVQEGASSNEIIITVTNPTVTFKEDDGAAPSFTAETAYDVTVNRALIADLWNSLCLPFSMTADEVSANFNPATEGLMKMTGIENNTVNFEDATTIEAGEMYIVKPTAEVTSFTASSKTLSTPASKTFNTTEWSVSSPMYQTAISQEADNTKFVLSNNQFYTVDQQNIEIKGFRWYITNTPVNGTPAKKTLLLSMNGITTGLSTADIDAESNSNGKFIENGSIVIKNGGKTFNTAGQRVK